MDIIKLLEGHASRADASAAPFVDYNGARLGYADILSRSRKIAGELASYGFARGAVCGLVCFNHVNFILYFTACLRAGIVPIIISAKYGADELRAAVAASGIRAVITDSVFGLPADAAAGPEGRNVAFITPGAGGRGGEAGEALYGDVLSDGTLFMLITSASGGRPKIVKKNAAALSYQAEKLYPQIKSAGATRYFTNVPPSHSYGLEFAVFGSIYNGVPLFLRDFNFSGDAFEEIALNSVTHIFSVPPFILSLADFKASSGLGFDALEMVVSAGMPLLPGLPQKFHAAFGFDIASVYGITEVGCVSFLNAKRGGGGESPTVNNDVGFPLEGNSVAVVGDAGEDLPRLDAATCRSLREGDSDSIRADIGRIVVRKRVADGGYYGTTEGADAEKWRRGFTELETGDSGYLDHDGKLHLLGRSSAFINIGGVKINAQDVERVLRSFAMFRDVLVFGRRDGYMGEKIAAAVVVDENSRIDAEDVRRMCAEKLPAIKVPREVYLLSEPFPRTSAGKVRFDKVLEMAGITPREK